MIINPHKITDFNRSDYDLQAFAFFCICVAGKSSEMQAKKLEIFLAPFTETPFERVNTLNKCGNLITVLTQSKLGQYKRISKAFIALATSGLDLRTCSISDLEKIPGLGLKTSRFFIVHSRSNQEYAILDTHILRHMRTDLNIPTPKTTPTNSAKYYALEKQYLEVVRASGKSFAEYDLQVWSKRVLDKAKKPITISS